MTEQSDLPNLAIVTSGGGMTCAYSAGALLGLNDRFKTIIPKWAIGSSGSVGTLAYMVSGQYHCIRNIWENLLPVKKFIDLKRIWCIIDIDYLIDEVVKKQDPLDIEAVKSSPTELLIAATNCKTGKVRYFSSKEDVDIFEALRASKAMPIVYGKKVAIGGEEYFDGDLTASVAVNIMEAIKRGATKIIVIDNKIFSQHPNFARRAMLRLLTKNVIKEMRQASIDPLTINVAGVQIIHVRPTKTLPTGLLDNDSDHIRTTIDIGYEDVLKHPELAELA